MTAYKADQLNRVVGFIQENPGAMRSDIAKLLGLKITAYFKNDIVGRLINEGWLRAEQDFAMPMRPVWRYYLTEQAAKHLGDGAA
jgi:hypothetical protein